MLAPPQPMPIHPELQAEQAYIDRAYDRLDAMRHAAEDLRDSVIGASRGGTHQARVERDVFVSASLARLEQLQLGRSSLCFGRIDLTASPSSETLTDAATLTDATLTDATRTDDATLTDAATESTPVESFYIGRLAVSDEQQEPLVVDWRAPVAEGFYRATGRAPMGLRRRRHFATDGRRLLGIEDELLGVDGPAPDNEMELVGPGALLAALGRSRSGQMRDIVATVQREQDEIIRAELPGVLVVQGGPGTGKTAVALHRAAYLLYTHRFPLERQGVLVVGPNQVFLRYIEQVLPSLGESGVALATLSSMWPRTRPRPEPSVVARVKGDARMADVLAHAVADRERGLRADLRIGYGALTLRVSPGMTRSIVNAARRRPGAHNARRRQVEAMLLRALYDDYVAVLARGRRSGVESSLVGPDGDVLDHGEFASQLRRDPSVVTALDRMWPVLTPEALLNDLFGAPALLALSTRGVLEPAERDVLARPRAQTPDDVEWTTADVPLLDEARALLGPPKARRRGRGRGDGDDPAEEPRGYGHIVVDEAQDLAPMALRMLARRSISGSMTLVGDIGQATSSSAPAGWDQVVEHLRPRRPPRLVTLSVNYRTPAEIMETAAAVLEAANVEGVVAPRSVRATSHLPEVRAVPQAGALAEEVALVAAAEVEAVAGGTVAVIAHRAVHDLLAARLAVSGLPWGQPERTGLAAPVTLLDVLAAKGLEFDSVIVVEPCAIVAEVDEGLRALFVALTRPTQRLVIVHAEPLPTALLAGLARARTTVSEGPVPGLPNEEHPAMSELDGRDGGARAGRAVMFPSALGTAVQGQLPFDDDPR